MEERPRVLGVDHGERRIGLAVSDPLGLTAQPVRCAHVDDAAAAVAAVAGAAAELEVGRVVVGLPRNMDGSLGPRARAVLAFVDALGEAVDVPVETWDERLSTREAQKVMRAAGVKRSRRKRNVDTVAAQIVLQSYLDARQP
jgi:putative Holliday junction resolvase